MKKVFFTVLLLGALGTTAYGLESSAGIYTGIGFNHIIGEDWKNSVENVGGRSSPQFGLTFGGLFQLEFVKYFSLVFDLAVENLGTRYEVDQTITDLTFWHSSLDVWAKPQIPILFDKEGRVGTSLYFLLGGGLGIMMLGTVKAKDDRPLTARVLSPLGAVTPPFVLAPVLLGAELGFGFGADFRLWKGFLSLDARYYINLSPHFPPVSGDKNDRRLNRFRINLGYRLLL